MWNPPYVYMPSRPWQGFQAGQTSKTITTGTKKLQELYKTFERKVLNASTKGNGSKDLPSDFRESSNKISKDTNDKNEDVGFELESLDGSEFDMDMDETKPGGEYTADSFAANDDSDDSDDERNDDNVSDVSSDEEVQGNPETSVKEVRQRKLSDPRRLHPDLWFNEKGEGNDGPVCKCCAKDKEHGIKHAIYPGEKIPLSSLIRFNIEYSIHLIKEPLPKVRIRKVVPYSIFYQGSSLGEKKPAAFRIDDILFDSENENVGKRAYPLVLHHSIRPVQMSYSGNPKYQKLWKSYIRLRNTLANSSMRRDVEVTMSSQGLKKTGINSDICQLALTHPSCYLNFGMNPDQARNTLTNCGVKQPRYGDRRIHRMNTKKKGY
ncbi:hypothetical protein QZH41_004365 [Actinostola sp. cb2023]|nr:hypothetical protein QZH41_004365 [Actinostola sp. cb2023]